MVELASPEWVELARTFLTDAVPEMATSAPDVAFSICESFTNPPRHLDDGHNRSAWWFKIDGPHVEVEAGARTDLLIYYEAPYAEALPRARTTLPEPTLETLESASSPLDPRLSAQPLQLLQMLTRLHNFLADRTLDGSREG